MASHRRRGPQKLSTEPVAGPSCPKPPKTISKPVKKYQVCKYFTTDRGCYNGERCRFLHGADQKEPPREQAKTCKFYANGYCLHGSKCWFKHVPSNQPPATDPSSSTSATLAVPAQEDEDEITCGICFEAPDQFGLLSGCSHAFCLTCLRDWRKSRKKDMNLLFSNIIKTCPLCRTTSKYITPSSQFYADGDPGKQKILEDYKASMARVECRYFARSSPLRRFCPYGSDCFYKHENPNGTPYTFDYGVDRMMMLYKEKIQDGFGRGPARYRMLRPAYRGGVVEDGLSDGPDPLDAFGGHDDMGDWASNPRHLAFGIVPAARDWDSMDIDSIGEFFEAMSLEEDAALDWA